MLLVFLTVEGFNHSPCVRLAAATSCTKGILWGMLPAPTGSLVVNTVAALAVTGNSWRPGLDLSAQIGQLILLEHSHLLPNSIS